MPRAGSHRRPRRTHHPRQRHTADGGWATSQNTLCGKPFTDLLTVGGRILYDTHFGPLLQLGGDLNGVTVDIVAADGTRLPMFLTANVKM